MSQSDYDIIVLGGGLGGSALAKAMAEHGVRVLVLEREREFKDRMRGEGVTWGCVDAKKLGLYDLIRQACGRQPRWLDTYLGTTQIDHSDIFAKADPPYLAFPHAAMEEQDRWQLSTMPAIGSNTRIRTEWPFSAMLRRQTTQAGARVCR
jgi:menaquinone-9 beta-reductase